jgi:transcriptional regulator with XRE-family HTH domain
MATLESGAYLRMLRDRNQLSRDQLAEAVGVKRGTIERLEKGDPTVAVGTVMQVITILGASPWHYHLLSTKQRVLRIDALQRDAIIAGIATYLIALAHHHEIALATIAEVMGTTVESIKQASVGASMLPDLAILLGLIAVNVPLADITPIVQATHSHQQLGRQLADDRAALVLQTSAIPPATQEMGRGYPILETILRRLAVIQSNSEPVLRLEVAAVIADIEKLRTVLIILVQLESNSR